MSIYKMLFNHNSGFVLMVKLFLAFIFSITLLVVVSVGTMVIATGLWLVYLIEFLLKRDKYGT